MVGMLFSCKKTTCWSCECLNTVNGVVLPDKTICQDEKPNPNYTDTSGNLIQYDCKR